MAGEVPAAEGEHPELSQRNDGSFLIDGMMSAQDAFERLDLRTRPQGDFHTVAGFVFLQLEHLPKAGETFAYEGWRFEVVDMDGRRIDKVLAIPPAIDQEESVSSL